MAAFIAPEVIDEIIRKSDIVEVISAYVPLKRQGKNYIGLCPFHSEDTPSFTVTPDKQMFYCFGCQKGGNVLRFVMEMDSLTLPQAAEKLAARAGVTIPRAEYTPQESAKQKRKQQLLRAHQLAAAFYGDSLKGREGAAARAYMQKRGISIEIAAKFCLGYSPDSDWEALDTHLQKAGIDHDVAEEAGLVSKSSKTGKFYDKFHGRLIFPIRDYRGEVIAFGGRIIGDGQPKYLNSTETPIYSKSHNLFGLSEAAAAIRREDCAIVVEGYLDVVICHQFGVDNAVAPLGTAFTDEQARLLKRYTGNVLLCFDGDGAGQKASARSIDILRPQGFNVKVLSLPSDSDPDDFLQKNGLEGWQSYRSSREQGVLAYFLQQARAKFPADTPEDKARVVAELLPALAATKSQVERESFISDLAGRLQVSPNTIYTDLERSGLKITRPTGREQARPPRRREVITNADLQILRFMLEDKVFFAAVEQSGFLPDLHDDAAALLALVKNLGDDYGFVPITLLERIDEQNEGLRKFLLKLLQVNVPEFDNKEGKTRLLGEYIKARRIKDLQQQTDCVKEALKNGDGDQRELLLQITALQQQIQRLKAEVEE